VKQVLIYLIFFLILYNSASAENSYGRSTTRKLLATASRWLRQRRRQEACCVSVYSAGQSSALDINRRVARIFHGGGAKKLRGCSFFAKKLTPFFSRRPQNLSSPSSAVHIFEAHRTHLIERTVLLYWTKQALRPNKASFFPVKKSTQSTIGVHAPSPWLRPWRLTLQ